MAAEDLSVVRRSLVPQAHDTWESIAQAMFAQVDLESAVSQLQSWNLHVFSLCWKRFKSALMIHDKNGKGRKTTYPSSSNIAIAFNAIPAVSS